LGFQLGASLGSCEVPGVFELRRFGHFKAEVQFRPSALESKCVQEGESPSLVELNASN
jgi:hypothetical protein